MSDTIHKFEAAGLGKAPKLWREYDFCAEWCAKRGLTGKVGEPLPELLSDDVFALINDDTDAFAERVRSMAYALAMESRGA